MEERLGDPVRLVPRIVRARRLWRLRHPGAPLVLAGVSLGAHAVALAEAHATAHPAGTDRARSCDLMILALPAWTGDPDGTAELTRAAGAEVQHAGRTSALDRIRRESDDAGLPSWVLQVLTQDWAHYTDTGLATALVTAGSSRAPDARDLADVRAPSLVIGLHGDALHPVSVAQTWTETMPRARLADVDIRQVSLREGLGHPTVVDALRRTWAPSRHPRAS